MFFNITKQRQSFDPEHICTTETTAVSCLILTAMMLLSESLSFISTFPR